MSVSTTYQCRKDYEAATAATREARMKWWREARFGMFVHFGLYALFGREEWVMLLENIPTAEYEKKADLFQPRPGCAREWAKLAAEAGMKYMVLTTKHHEGFCLWDTRMTDYNAVQRGPKRDLVAEYVAACRKHGLKFGLYYSQDIDFHHPHGGGYTQGRTVFRDTSWTNDWDFPDNARKNYDICFVEKIRPQVEEILRNYGELCLIWFDNPLTISKAQSLELYSLVKKYQPGCLLNSRLGSGACDYRSLGDNEIGNEYVGEELVETPATLNDTWGYKSFDQNWKTAEQVLTLKKHLNERGINYLLNVGPDYLGRIPAPSIEILRQVGVARVND